MSQEFKTRNEAFDRGFYLAGRNDLIGCDFEKNSEINIIKDFTHISKSGCENPIMIEFKNINGVYVQATSSEFRDSYDLWLVSQEISLRI